MAFFLVYKFTCASCSSSYISETCRHFKTRTEKHIKKNNKSHIFKHLHSSETCVDSYNSLCFKIIDKAHSKFDLKIKEGLHINWRKPNLHCLIVKEITTTLYQNFYTLNASDFNSIWKHHDPWRQNPCSVPTVKTLQQCLYMLFYCFY